MPASPPLEIGAGAEYVITSADLEQPRYLLAYARGCTEEDGLVLRHRLPREEAIHAVVVVVVPQLGDRAIPVPMGGARSCQRLVVGLRHAHLAENAHLGCGYVAVEPGLAPVGASPLGHGQGIPARTSSSWRSFASGASSQCQPSARASKSPTG